MRHIALALLLSALGCASSGSGTTVSISGTMCCTHSSNDRDFIAQYRCLRHFERAKPPKLVHKDRVNPGYDCPCPKDCECWGREKWMRANGYPHPPAFEMITKQRKQSSEASGASRVVMVSKGKTVVGRPGDAVIAKPGKPLTFERRPFPGQRQLVVRQPAVWEYKIISLPVNQAGSYDIKQAEKTFNRLGAEGWEFVTYSQETRVVFRRRKQSTGTTLMKVNPRILPELSQVRIMICAGGDWAAHRNKRTEHFAKKKSAEMFLVHVEKNEIGTLYKDEKKAGRENWNKVIVLAAATKAKELYDLTPASKDGKRLDIVLDVDREVPYSYVKELLDALVKQGIDSSQFMVVTSGKK